METQGEVLESQSAHLHPQETVLRLIPHVPDLAGRLLSSMTLQPLPTSAPYSSGQGPGTPCNIKMAGRGPLAPDCFGHSSEAWEGSKKRDGQGREEEVEME